MAKRRLQELVPVRHRRIAARIDQLPDIVIVALVDLHAPDIAVHRVAIVERRPVTDEDAALADVADRAGKRPVRQLRGDVARRHPLAVDGDLSRADAVIPVVDQLPGAPRHRRRGRFDADPAAALGEECALDRTVAVHEQRERVLAFDQIVAMRGVAVWIEIREHAHPHRADALHARRGRNHDQAAGVGARLAERQRALEEAGAGRRLVHHAVIPEGRAIPGDAQGVPVIDDQLHDGPVMA